MDEIQVFNFNGKDVRTILIDGNVYFVGKDVAIILGYAEPRSAISKKVDNEDKGVAKMETPSGTQDMTVINESGLYSLVLSSQMPQAKVFKRWVTSEVLPSIRKTGLYNAKLPSNYIEALEKLLESEKEKEKLKIENEVMKPKSDYFDKLVSRNLLTNFRDTAKELHIKQRKFIDWLIDSKFVYRDAKNQIKPYMSSIDNGLFEIKEFSNRKHSGVQTLITPKGRETFRLLLGGNKVNCEDGV